MVVSAARLDSDLVLVIGELCDRPAFAHLGSGTARMFQEQIVEGSALDLKRGRFARKTAVAKNQLERFAGVAEMKLRAELFWKSRSFEHGQHAHLLEQPAIVRQQRFADMEPWEMLLFQHQYALAGASQQSGCRAAARPTANHQCIISFRHTVIKACARISASPQLATAAISVSQ